MRKVGISYHVDKTYIKIKGIWYFSYRSIDSYGDTIDFLLTSKRNTGAIFKFFRKVLGSSHCSRSEVINVDRNKSYPTAFKGLKKAHILDSLTQFRQKKYLNNIIEQDHRFIKKLVTAELWFKSPLIRKG